MNQEIYSLGIMLFISCAALIGAINSRGTVKMVFSYLLAFICLAGTGFLIGQYVSNMSQAKAFKFEESNKALEQKVEEMQQTLEETMKEEAEQSAQEAAKAKAIADYKKEAYSVLLKGQKVASRLTGYKLVVGSDSEYEEAVKKANYYLAESRRILKEAKALTAPEDMAKAQENFLKGLETLATATSRMRRYYTAENSQEEQDIANIFKYKIQQAKDILSQSEQELQ